MERLEKLIAQKIEARLEAKLDGILDGILERAIESALMRILGVEIEAEAAAPEAKAKRTRKAKAKAKDEAEAKAEAKAEAPAPKAEVAEPTDKLLARLESVAERLGERYGPMLLRRARAIAKHAINPHGALAVIVAWAETTEPTEVVATLRGSEKLPDGTTLSGWRLMAARLGIPVKA